MSDIERFELLSAYLDGEVTPEQRQQVQDWLDTDPEFREVYQKLLKLQGSCTNLAYPPTPVSADQVQVKLQKRLQQQRRKGWLIGGDIATQLSISLNRPLVVIPYEVY